MEMFFIDNDDGNHDERERDMPIFIATFSANTAENMFLSHKQQKNVRSEFNAGREKNVTFPFLFVDLVSCEFPAINMLLIDILSLFLRNGGDF